MNASFTNPHIILLSLAMLIAAIGFLVFTIKEFRKERRARVEAALDAMIYGSGYVRINADGTEKRIDPRDIYFKANPSEKPGA